MKHASISTTQDTPNPEHQWGEIYLPWRYSSSGPRSPHCRGFTIALRHNILGRTPVDEWSARRRDLYLTTHYTHKRKTPMPPAGIETTIPASERPQTHTLNRAEWGELQSEKNSLSSSVYGGFSDEPMPPE